MVKERPGAKTTEFWVALAALALAAAPQAFGDDPSPWIKIAGVIGAALVAAGYGFSRAISKTGNTETSYNIVTPDPINTEMPSIDALQEADEEKSG